MKGNLVASALFLALMLAACSGKKEPMVEGKEISYSADSVTMKGYLAYDAAREGRRPGIIVVHEWWGLNDYTRKRARMLAGLGYTALAVDMYGDGKTASHPDDAGKFAAAVMQNMDAEKARFMAAFELLKQQPTTDSTRIAAIGYCFGGEVALQMAREGVDLKGVVSFHGSLGTSRPAQPGMVKASLLVCNGADDPFNPTAAVEAFKKEMTDAKVNFQFISYPGAKHAFTNPDADSLGKLFNLPLAYNQAADSLSWSAMQKFLQMILAQ